MAASYGRLDPEVIIAFTELERAGIHCTFATGRGYWRTRKCIGDDFAPTYPLVLENGARICEPDGTTIYAKPLGVRTLQALRTFMTRKYLRGVDFFQLEDGHHVSLHLPGTPALVKNTFLDAQYIAAKYRTRTAFMDHLLHARCCKLTFFGNGKGDIPFPKHINCVRNQSYQMVMRRGVSKATAVRWLCTQRNIDLADVLVAGNDFNDVPLFELPTGWRVAVGSTCPPGLRTNATHHVTSPQAFGTFLQEFC